MKPNILCLGIDYSIGSPAVCSFRGQSGTPFQLSGCSFSYVHLKTSSKTPLSDHCESAISCKYPNWETPEDRYSAVFSEVVWPMLVGMDEWKKIVLIEGYSFSSKGQVFQIAENAGYAKVEMWKKGCLIQTIAPTSLKKYATGDGKADKIKMILQFHQDTGIDIHTLITPNKKLGTSPVSDIVDAYYLCKYQWEHLKEET